jgi:carbonic anhydrase/acetyltransferase-like protein (isoleucine patch superfamily)
VLFLARENKMDAYKNYTPKVGKQVYVHPSAVIIGKVTIEDNCSVWPCVAIRGDVNEIIIGKETNIQDGAVLHVTHIKDKENPGFPLIIGQQVTVGHKALLHGCTIGNQVLIGMGAIIMDGVIIQDKVVVAAGSLVAPGKLLKSKCLYKGQPATFARELTSKELDNLTYSAKHYVRLKDDYIQ